MQHEVRGRADVALLGDSLTQPRRSRRARAAGRATIAGPVRRLYHLAVPPAAFTSVIGLLGASGLARDARVIIEKPFGTDLDAARALNQAVHRSSTSRSCSASTTSWAKNRSTTSWPSGEFLAKIPGAELSLGRTKMTFSYKDSFATANTLEGYERLILLAMVGDQSLFTRSDGMERLWEIPAPLLDNPPPVEPHEPARGAYRPPTG
jgi:glucose-6-phosphate 1-dehydrogenase